MPTRKSDITPPKRSAKAGRPPMSPTPSPQAGRRRKTAHTAVRKDTMILEAPRGARVLWGVTRPKVKKG